MLLHSCYAKQPPCPVVQEEGRKCLQPPKKGLDLRNHLLINLPDIFIQLQASFSTVPVENPLLVTGTQTKVNQSGAIRKRKHFLCQRKRFADTYQIKNHLKPSEKMKSWLNVSPALIYI